MVSFALNILRYRIEMLFLSEDNDLETYIYMRKLCPGVYVTSNCCLVWYSQISDVCSILSWNKKRLADMNWDTCRQNLLNWVDKGAVQFNKLIPAFKEGRGFAD